MQTEPFQLVISAPAVAWYAATIATITALIQVSNYFRDRALIKITYQRDMQAINDPQLPPDMIFVFVRAVNVGRRPVTIAQIYFAKLKEKGGWVVLDTRPPLPCEITEGRYVAAFVDQTGLDFSNIAQIVAVDVAGRSYSVPVAPLGFRVWWAISKLFNLKAS